MKKVSDAEGELIASSQNGGETPVSSENKASAENKATDNVIAQKTVVEPLSAAHVTSQDHTKKHPPGHHKRDKKHKAHIEHKIPGRIRLKIPMAKSNPDILELYKATFSLIPGVTHVKIKPLTGSVIIDYDPRFEDEFHKHLHSSLDQHQTSVVGPRPGDEIEEMAKKIEAEAEFLAQKSELARAAVDFFKAVDKELKVSTGNNIDLKIVLATGLAAYTFLEIGAEAATPMWVTLALFSINHFAELQHENENAYAR